MSKWIFGFGALLILSACVSKKEYAALQATSDKHKEEFIKKDKEYGELAVQADAFKDNIALAEKQNSNLQKALEACLSNSAQGSANITKLLDEVNKSNAYIKKLVDSKFKNDSLNLFISNSSLENKCSNELSSINATSKLESHLSTMLFIVRFIYG